MYFIVFLLCVTFLLPQKAIGLDAGKDFGAQTCLIQDPHVQKGVIVYDPVEGIGHNPSGTLKGIGDDGQSIWGLSQWNSKLPFRGAPIPTAVDNSLVKYDSGSKSICFGALQSVCEDVVIGLNTSKEYSDGLRKKNERWQAFYLWQLFKTTKPISELTATNFLMDAKLHFSNNLHVIESNSLEDNVAQFTVFLTVQNINKSSANFGRYVWFGLPIYDNRFVQSPQHQQKDLFTKKFIYLVESSVFAKHSLHDGGWTHFEADLLPEIKRSLQLAIDNGYFLQPVSTNEFSIKSIHVGWEIPGSFDAEIQFKDLSLCIN